MSEINIKVTAQLGINQSQSIKDSFIGKDLRNTNNSSQSTPSDLNVSIIRINNFNQIKLSETTRSHQSFTTFAQLSVYNPSATLSANHYQKKTANIKSVQIQEVKDDQLFECQTCRITVNKNCQLCKGTQKIRGNCSLIKFFEYVIEFKLGTKQSYKEKKISNLINKTNTSLCNSKIKSSNFRQIQQTMNNRMSVRSTVIKKCNKNDIEAELNSLISVHQNYMCDSCQKTPIVGPRYHCLQCKDYDQCQQCFKTLFHEHKMQKINRCGKGKQLQSMINIFNQPLRLSNFSLGPPPSIASQFQYKKLFKSSGG